MDLTGDTTTSVVNQPVNPQRNVMFTWLSAIATRFEMYRFTKLKFIFKPSCSTTTDGWIALGFDFDTYDATPTKSEILTWKYSSKSSPWEAQVLDVSKDSRLSTYRYADNGERGDSRLDILGNLIALVYTETPDKFVGELFVQYSIIFRMPSYKIPPALYTTFGENLWSAPTAASWFDAATKTGNMTLKIIDDATILLQDVGSFLITAGAVASSGLTELPGLTFSSPSDSPSSSFISQVTQSAFSSNSTITQYLLRVLTPPVLVSADAFTTGTALSSVFRIATYQK